MPRTLTLTAQQFSKKVADQKIVLLYLTRCASLMDKHKLGVASAQVFDLSLAAVTFDEGLKAIDLFVARVFGHQNSKPLWAFKVR